ncbi:2,3-bisphosphoglycerate-independent phosphoglycerate mutase [Legionella septentrionalis]|uniref:2,3-bisphosphoglycerate-independent phosphoglycerate mutase n=1 Tax=Legionella septentrionalis TaxID=2498109 RepID=UPI000F8DAD61|nr:2,3-bisphosphoglycerate-independent phosphoglycerate mutase [Legionella septentrionalis]RUR09295.1 2,3-bisphosphoglycerate-independent phosphoglycerate mutase [Legionella septentrionalis]
MFSGKKPPLVLLILDGWGYCENSEHNAIAQAHTPHWDKWWKTEPHILLQASGNPVGLPAAQMGNSEVGHMHIGAGRVIYQDYTLINEAIKTGEFFNNPVFLNTIEEIKQQGKALHVMGLLSPGGVHSHENHLFSFLTLCAEKEFFNVYLHLFLDGRDTPPQSAAASIKRLQDHLNKYPVGFISSICGRYYAMDRDKRWERVYPVYQLLTEVISPYEFNTPEEALAFYYQQQIYDEFIPPTRIGIGKAITDGDAIFFFNFRADRARQLTQAFTLDEFDGFTRVQKPQLAAFISMTRYAKNLPTKPAFPPASLKNTLGEVLAYEGLTQLRIAETEKYAHVTFFLNGGSEQIYPNEDRILIQSPHVATYDEKPEMSAPELTKTLIDAIKSGAYDVIICNYANADMVGHTGNFAATVKAIEYLDKAMHEIWLELQHVGGKLLITADHGNAEMMFDESTSQPHTAHTSEAVPFLYLGGNWHFNAIHGSLIDIAPTLLTLLDITPPVEMTGKPLLVKNHAHAD